MIKLLQNAAGKINTLFSRFLLIFIALTFLISLISVFTLVYESKKKELHEIEKNIFDLHLSISKSNEFISSFFIRDLISEDFYKTGTSSSLELHDSLTVIIKAKIQKIENLSTAKLTLPAKEINTQFEQYRQLINTMVKLSLERGFNDYGLVGKMRNNAHKLENMTSFSKQKLLMLRRHEKDYIIRRKTKYVNLFKEKQAGYFKEIRDSKIPDKEKNEILKSLKQYSRNFEKLIELDKALGVKTNSGLSEKIQMKRDDIQENLKTIITESELFITNSENKIKQIYTGLTILLLSIGFTGGLLIIKQLTRPISRLSANITSFINSDLSESVNFEYKTKITELVNLIENYFLMKRETLSLIHNFRKKVEERTEEIEAQKDLLQKQKIKVEKINNEMLASIRYAQTIQEALLPKQEKLAHGFKDHFIIFKPRDIVSGDFFWFEELKTETRNIKLLAIADCTGHGVPGALMSMLSIAYLNEIVLRKEIHNTGEVLDILRNKITQNFTHDGLDLAFILIDETNKEIEFSGANRNLYIKRNNELIKLKGNRMPIGKYPSNNNFEYQVFEYNAGDLIFAFSDGITDQLNNDGRKLGTKKFLKKIENYNTLTEIKNAVEKKHEKWKGKVAQIDDILFFGAKL